MRKYLSESEAEDIRRIVEAENEETGAKYGIPDDADRYVLKKTGGHVICFAGIYELGETFGGRGAVEVSLFTDRGYRRKHLAAGMLSRCLNEGKVLKFSQYGSEAGDAFLKAAGASYDYDELCMELRLPDADVTEYPQKEELPENGGIRYYNAHSELYVLPMGKKAYVYGVRTDAGHLRKGSAGALLREVLPLLRMEGFETAMLQVSGKNVPALRLYEKCGFAVTERLKIWHL